MLISLLLLCFFFFFSCPPSSSAIYTLSLHDALPILALPQKSDGTIPKLRQRRVINRFNGFLCEVYCTARWRSFGIDRKSTRLNSSHRCISYAVFCLKKKKKKCSNTHS